MALIEQKETSGGVRYEVRHDEALISVGDILTRIEYFNADNSTFPDHKDVTLADVTIELTRMANGGRDPRPKNEHAAGIAQDIMAECIYALEEALEDDAE